MPARPLPTLTKPLHHDGNENQADAPPPATSYTLLPAAIPLPTSTPISHLVQALERARRRAQPLLLLRFARRLGGHNHHREARPSSQV